MQPWPDGAALEVACLAPALQTHTVRKHTRKKGTKLTVLEKRNSYFPVGAIQLLLQREYCIVAIVCCWKDVPSAYRLVIPLTQ